MSPHLVNVWRRDLAWSHQRIKALDHKLRALESNESISRGAEGQQPGECRPMHREGVSKSLSLAKRYKEGPPREEAEDNIYSSSRQCIDRDL
jgi:hypothetical protein